MRPPGNYYGSEDSRAALAAAGTGENALWTWIAWDDTLETGHARMDADHRKRAELFGLLRDAAEHGSGTLHARR